MAGKLNVQITRSGMTWVVTFSGAIDEDSELLDALKGVSGYVQFDLSGVAAINSCGVREWINALRELDGKVTLFEFTRVSVPMVQQFNMIVNARGNGRVVSFMAPYYCPQCRKPREMLLTPESDKELQQAGALSAPERKCPGCGSTLEFDEIEEKYLNFLEMQLRKR
jgi:hypothetical protein